MRGVEGSIEAGFLGIGVLFLLVWTADLLVECANLLEMQTFYEVG